MPRSPIEDALANLNLADHNLRREPDAVDLQWAYAEARSIFEELVFAAKMRAPEEEARHG